MRGEPKSGPKLVDKNSINLGPNGTVRPSKLTTSIIEVLKIKSSTTNISIFLILHVLSSYPLYVINIFGEKLFLLQPIPLIEFLPLL